MRRDEKDKLAGIGLGGLVGGRGLKAGQLAEAGETADAADSDLLRVLTSRAVLPSPTVTSETNWRLLRMGMLFRAVAGQCLDLEIDVHSDGAGLLHGGRRLQGEAEIFILNLRDGDAVEPPVNCESRLEALTPLMVTPAESRMLAVGPVV